MNDKVVITGLGAITPLGLDVDSFWEASKVGRSGMDAITLFDASRYTTRIAAEVKGFQPENYMEKKEARRMDRFVQFAVAAAGMALKDAGLPITDSNRDRIGVLVGSGTGGMWTWEREHAQLLQNGPGRVSPFLVPMMISDMASGQISICFGARGPNLAIVTACASGSHSISFAAGLIAHGDADVMITGGSEAAVSPLAVAGFCSMKALSTRNEEPTRASRPFDLDRDGFVMGEGSGILILESLTHARARGAKIYAELAGSGMSGDACHITAPAPDGEGAVRAMQMALKSAKLAPNQIDYINAHGTSTELNDRCETMAIKTLFGEHAYRMPISSSKSMIGHLLGASGAVELIACILSIRDSLIPPTINYETPDPACDLDYVPNQARSQRVDTALSNSFGFGGHNACLIVKRFEE